MHLRAPRHVVISIVILALGLGCALALSFLIEFRPPPPPAESEPQTETETDPLAEIIARGTAPLTGAVVDDEGEPVAGAHLEVHALSESRIVAWERAESDRAGLFTFEDVPVGQVAVLAQAEGLSREVRQVTVEPAGLIDLELALEPEAVVAGRVVLEDASPVAGAEVCARPRRESEVPELEAICDVSDERGRFRLGHLVVGMTAVAVGGEGLAPMMRPDVIAPASALLLRVARLTTLQGTVLRPDGEAAAGARVLIAGSGIWPPRTVETDSRGNFVAEGIPEGIYELEAHWEQMASRREMGVEVTADESPPVELELDHASELWGRVRDRRTGEPLSGATVSVAADMLALAPARTQTGEDGRFFLDGLAAGQYWLTVSAEGYVTAAGQPVAVPSEVEITLEGEAVVSGRVMDAEGYPLSGALIQPDLESAGGALPQPLAAPLPRASPLTAPAGTSPLTAPELPPGMGSTEGTLGVFPGLEAVPLPLGEPSAVPLPAEPEPPIDPRELTLEPAPAPPVELPELEPPQSPESAAAASSWPVRSRWDGTFEIRGLPPGRLRLIASHPSAASGRSEELILSAGDVIEGVEIILDPGTELSGRVLDIEGYPIAGAVVQLQGGTSRSGAVEVTAADGTFTFASVVGEVRLEVSREGYAETSLPIEIDSSQRRQEVEIRLIEADRRVLGRVVDAQGYPVGEARVSARSLDRGQMMTWETMAQSDGTFALEGLAGETVVLRAEAAGYAAGETVAGPGAEEVEIALRRSGALSVAVVDSETGRPLGACRAELRPAAGPRLRQVCVDGRVTFNDLEPGSALLYVEAPEHAAAEEPFDVPAGIGPDDPDAAREIALEPAIVVRGQVLDPEGEPVPGARVGLEPIPRVIAPRGSARWVESEVEGRFELAGVPQEGVSEIHVSHPIKGSAVVEVGPFWPQDEPDIEVVLDEPAAQPGGRRFYGLAVELATRAEAAEVVAVAPGSVAEAVGLRRGDRIVAVGSAPVTSAAAAYRALRGPAGTAALLTVERAGVEAVLLAERELVER